jgi:hypothetical protein
MGLRVTGWAFAAVFLAVAAVIGAYHLGRQAGPPCPHHRHPTADERSGH